MPRCHATANTDGYGACWPVHPGLQPDELLSSWLVRIARGNGLKLQSFCHMFWPGVELWTRDLDRSPPAEVLQTLAERTGVSPERIHEATLEAYQGRLFERHNPNGNNRWLMGLGLYHRTRRRHALQFCPRCLNDDGDQPYFRRHWRLSLATACPHHGLRLLDACPRCEAPVVLHRGELGCRQQVRPAPMTDCHVCGYDLRTAGSVAVTDTGLLAFEAGLLQAADTGWMAGSWNCYSHLFLAGAGQVLKLLGSRHPLLRGMGGKVWREVNGGSESKPFSPERGHGEGFDELRVGERHGCLHMANWLLTDWPERFVGFCRRERIYSSALLRDFPYAPFWYADVVKTHLYVVHAPWKADHPNAGHDSYALHVRSRSPENKQRTALLARLAFVRAHPWLWHRPKRLSLAMRQAGLYAAATHHSQIVPRCPVLIRQVLEEERVRVEKGETTANQRLLEWWQGRRFELMNNRRPEQGFRVSETARNHRTGLTRSAEWLRRHPKVQRCGHGNLGRGKYFKAATRPAHN